MVVILETHWLCLLLQVGNILLYISVTTYHPLLYTNSRKLKAATTSAVKLMYFNGQLHITFVNTPFSHSNLKLEQNSVSMGCSWVLKVMIC